MSVLTRWVYTSSREKPTLPNGLPTRHGLYEPSTEHDACGVGFVVHLRGEKSRSIVEHGLSILDRLRHRAACGADPQTADGAGILLQLPHRFFEREGLRLGFEMPQTPLLRRGPGLPPQRPRRARRVRARLHRGGRGGASGSSAGATSRSMTSQLGWLARRSSPVLRQVYVARRRVVPSAFERKLYVIRKLVENRIRAEGLDPERRFHVASLSLRDHRLQGTAAPVAARQLLPGPPGPGHGERAGPGPLALQHQHLPHLGAGTALPLHRPQRGDQHRPRQPELARRAPKPASSAKFGGSLDRLFPIVRAEQSDSAQFDNMLELLTLGGRSLPHAMMLMIPEAWEKHAAMDESRRAFYEYSSALLEPWDGPAAIAFTDGALIGATLDRNGLRPARWMNTDDDQVILASEAGVLEVPPERVRSKGRLQPGRMFLVDTEEGRIVEDDELKRDITGRWPYRQWLDKNVFTFDELPTVPRHPSRATSWTGIQRAFGYTDEDVRRLLHPWRRPGTNRWARWATTRPLAVLSDQAPSLFRYFHQLFAQVTNPAHRPDSRVAGDDAGDRHRSRRQHPG